MKFNIGDKVMVTTLTWQEKCTIIKMGYSRHVMFVRRANGITPAIYKSWASPITKPKNQQLVFDFMSATEGT